MNYSDHHLPDLRIEDDPELQEIEEILRRLPVREPSTMIDHRIAALTRPVRWVDAMRFMGLGAAAMLALAIGAWPLLHRPVSQIVAADQKPGTIEAPHPRTNVSKSSKAPSVASTLLLERTNSRITDDGVVAVVDGMPVQRLHKHSVQQVWMVDPKSGNPTLVTIPRDQVTLRRIEAY